MSHNIDFQDIEDRLMLLQHIIFGSYGYCATTEIGRNYSQYAADEWHEYSVNLKRIVSNHVIECAIKIRIIEDTLKSLGSKTDFRLKDDEAREELSIGYVHSGKVNLSLRESCNKVVHATSVDLGWAEKKDRSSRPIEYWNGRLHLHGQQQANIWHVELEIESWTQALRMYLFLIDEPENVDLFSKIT
ncbi:MAG: hypothetical protein KME16_03385 [Scytolyngbya sp. HA4215-MV1]|jgi:hypothetical protein|nr:hypothetical protein [Scytolyngbya sp. HA4215-MV1]